MRMGRVLHRLETLDRELQSRPPHPLMGTGSLHASIISGGRELSSYPDRCRLQMERRTDRSRERRRLRFRKCSAILDALAREDPEFEASAASRVFAAALRAIARSSQLPRQLVEASRSRSGEAPLHKVGMSFWTDAAVLGAAGIPSVLFGPGGAGLHSREEYVTTDDVVTCRDALSRLALSWC